MRKFYNSHSKYSINVGSISSTTSSNNNNSNSSRSGGSSDISRNHFAPSLVFCWKIKFTNLIMAPSTWEQYILKLVRDTL